jgi:hypothetical protein
MFLHPQLPIQSARTSDAQEPVQQVQVPPGERASFGLHVQAAGDLFQQLFCFIHSSVKGDCLQNSELPALYAGNKPVETQVMAHIVSCEPCRNSCMRHLTGESDDSTYMKQSRSGRKTIRSVRKATSFNLKRSRATILRLISSVDDRRDEVRYKDCTQANANARQRSARNAYGGCGHRSHGSCQFQEPPSCIGSRKTSTRKTFN